MHYFRSHGHATTPIILVEGTTYGQAWLLPKVSALQNPRRNALRTAYNALIAGGDKHLHYVTGDQLLRIDNDLVNPTVSGTHPTDLGHYQVTPPSTMLLEELRQTLSPGSSHTRLHAFLTPTDVCILRNVPPNRPSWLCNITTSHATVVNACQHRQRH